MDVLILRFDAPMMSFGAPIVDRHGVIQSYPAHSMITGLLGNALGLDHSDFTQLQRLQERIHYASRRDRKGQQIRDYQTVDLSQDFMQDSRAWTTYGFIEKRKNADRNKGTLLRFRDYWADSIHTIALTLRPQDEMPTLDNLEHALQYPERPIFVGRKTCLPAQPVFLERREAGDLLQALQETPLAQNADEKQRFRIWWPTNPEAEDPPADLRQPVTDRRDWKNQVHVGERWIAEGEFRITAQEENE